MKNNKNLSPFTSHLSPSRGFTLIELLVVIVIISILGSMSAVFYSRFLTQSNVSSVQDKLLGSFRKAQMYAMMSRQAGDWGVHYESSTNKIILFQGSTYGSRNTAFDESTNVASSINFGTFTDVTFSRITGLPKNGIPSNTPTITITGPNNTNKTIIINSQGVASR